MAKHQKLTPEDRARQQANIARLRELLERNQAKAGQKRPEQKN